MAQPNNEQQNQPVRQDTIEEIEENADDTKEQEIMAVMQADTAGNDDMAVIQALTTNINLLVAIIATRAASGRPLEETDVIQHELVNSLKKAYANIIGKKFAVSTLAEGEEILWKLRKEVVKGVMTGTLKIEKKCPLCIIAWTEMESKWIGICPNGHHFCMSCLGEHLQRDSRCPLCRTTLACPEY